MHEVGVHLVVNPEGLNRERALGLPLHAPHVAAVRGHHAARAVRQAPEVDHCQQIHHHATPLVPVDHLA